MTSNIAAEDADLTLRRDVVAEYDVLPTLGLLPKSRAGRFFLAWAAFNVVLTLLPVFLVFGNGTDIVWGLLPWTILYSYAVFTLNCVFGIAFYRYRAKPWSEQHHAGDR